jgi:hypothetical protein
MAKHQWLASARPLATTLRCSLSNVGHLGPVTLFPLNNPVRHFGRTRTNRGLCWPTRELMSALDFAKLNYAGVFDVCERSDQHHKRAVTGNPRQDFNEPKASNVSPPDGSSRAADRQ